LSLIVDGEVELVDHVKLPSKARRALENARMARAQVEAADRKAAKSAANAVRVLARDLRLSTRDVGELLGISHQRVHQIAHGKA
jgi:hypothetical protein